MIGGTQTPHLTGLSVGERITDALAGVPRLDNALCTVVEPEVFFAERGARGTVALAREICARCPVTRACLAAALEAEDDAGHSDRFGVWGGTSPRERHRLYVRGVRGVDGDLVVTDPSPEITPAPEPEPIAVAPVRALHEPARCGTRSGYQKHRREGQRACDPCRWANTAADRRLRATGSTKEAAA